MKIIQEICKYCREVELKKMTAFLKYKYRMKEHTINYSKDIEYVLPYSKRITPSERYPKDINESIASYNKFSDILLELKSDDNLKNTLFQLLVSHDKNSQQKSKNLAHQ